MTRIDRLKRYETVVWDVVGELRGGNIDRHMAQTVFAGANSAARLLRYEALDPINSVAKKIVPRPTKKVAAGKK